MKYFLYCFVICLSAFAQTQFLKGKFPLDNDLDYQSYDLTICDLDGDGDLDVLVARISDFVMDEMEGGFRWFENFNNDYFELRYIDTTIEFTTSLTYGDADGDGDIDLFGSAQYLSEVYLYENDGNENFTKHIIDSTALFELEALDLDQDGDMDLLGRPVNYYDSTAIYWYENNGNQIYAKNFVDSVFRPSDMECVDLDGDGNLDIVISSSYAGAFQWYKNDGNQNFVPTNVVDSTYEITGISISDLDQDGDQDIVVASYPDNDIVWYENDGNENFNLNAIPQTDNAHSVQAVDMEGDGDVDIVATYELSIKWYENNGTQNFTEQFVGKCSSNAYSYIGYFMRGIPPYIVDYDGDGDMDIFALDRVGYSVKLFKNYGNNNFGVQLVYGQDFGLNFQFMDFDSDGDLDILATSNNGILWMEKFENNQYAYHVMQDGNYFYSVMDMDGDNDLDFVYSKYSYLMWAENINNEFYDNHVIAYNYDANAGKPYLKDLDLDGDIDIVCLSVYGPGISWYENFGSQGFTGSQIMNGTVNSFLVEDLDQDGDFDIVACRGSSGDDVFWYQNDGSANFTYLAINDSVEDPAELMILDMDADGDFDILSMEDGADEIIYLKNDGTENFTRMVISEDTYNIKTFIAADFDQNNSIDILLLEKDYGNPENQKLILLTNDGNQNFTTHIVWDSVVYANNSKLMATDIDLDSDLDVFMYGNILTARNAHLFENTEINDFLHLQIHPFIDPNTNGILDSTEYSFQTGNMTVFPEADYQFLNGDNIELYLSTGQDYELILNLDNTLWEGTDSLSRNFLTVDSALYVDTNLFIGVNAINEYLYSTDIAGAWPRCGQTIRHTLTVQNLGTESDMVYLDYELPADIQYVSSDPVPAQINGQMLSYELEDILTAQIQQVKLNVTLPIEIDTIDYHLELRVDTGQMAVLASASFTEIIRCSFDPNDKQVFPNYGEEGYILAGEELEYLIRFQNTGNDTAFLVVVQDDLDSKLDIQSFTLISNSHPVSVKQDFENHRLEFRFEDINLMDTVTNEEESHGFVKFRINVLDSLSVGEQIENTAHIYFDQNNPIITNTTLNELYECDLLGANIDISDTVFYTGWNHLNISLEDEYVESASWKIDGTEMSSSIYGFSPVFTTAGVQSLDLHLENAFCEKDTTLFFTVVDNIGLTDNSFGESIHIYPNPNNGLFKLVLEKEHNNVQLTIITLLGQVIKTENYESLESTDIILDQAPGIYLLKIQNEVGKSAVFRIVKE